MKQSALLWQLGLFLFGMPAREFLSQPPFLT